MVKYPYQDNAAWRNGQFCRVRDLNVSILDLGLIHADATYEVIAIRNNKPIMIDEHLDRFYNSCKYWRLPMPWAREQLKEAIKAVHWMSGMQDSIIWLSVTRGVPENGNPRNLTECDEDVIIYVKPYQKFNGTGEATVCLAETVRRVPDACINQACKNFSWPDLTRAQWEAKDRGYDTAVLLSYEGCLLTEGPGFNVAVVQDDYIFTPKRDVLPGITMLAVERAAKELGLKFARSDIIVDKLESVIDDMFLTTTVGNIVTVTNYNGRQLTPSPVQLSLKKYLEGD
jgi:branched-chain amino acid aminotransferase